MEDTSSAQGKANSKSDAYYVCVQTHFFWQLNWGATGISSELNPSKHSI